MTQLNSVSASLAELPVRRRFGQLAAVRSGSVDVVGLGGEARVGDLIHIGDGEAPSGEIVALDRTSARAMTFQDSTGLALHTPVALQPAPALRPTSAWQGRIIDAFGQPLDGRPLPRGQDNADLRALPPPATGRRSLGDRLGTGIAAIDTMLPLVKGQRIGVFAGSGVGKSSLLAELARKTPADRVVLALIGERGRELRHFTDQVLGEAGLARSIVVAATSDQSPLIKRRAGWTAMAVAEALRDTGDDVLLLVDSLTRMAEAHREVALTAGEPASLRAYPPSTGGMIAALTERAGPGGAGQGDITAVFSVLVAGSDMDEPVADMTRGVLDGHIVLDREIAERGRYPAIDVRRSVSRSLPQAASADENTLILKARQTLATYEAAYPMVQAGLYVPGSDAAIDRALEIWPRLDAFFSQIGEATPATAFAALEMCVNPEKGE
ncbi:MAG: FliI/YscN family ATPase [Pseudomonadota bacterium]